MTFPSAALRMIPDGMSGIMLNEMTPLASHCSGIFPLPAEVNVFPKEPLYNLFMKKFYVYIMTNRSRTLYTGVTNNLERRVQEHKSKKIPGFTEKYNITQLAYFEETGDVGAAIAREKQIKGWLRAKKIALIESLNPSWRDLSEDWYKEEPSLRLG